MAGMDELGTADLTGSKHADPIPKQHFLFARED